MLPSEFAQRMQSCLPDFQDFAAAVEAPAPTAIRINPLKAQINPHSQQISPQQVPWCSSAYYLPQRPSFTLDPRFHAGAYYVQDASCMLLEAALQHLELQPQRILDACAAPGGKTTHLASLFPHSQITANELIRSRARILADNLAQWGSTNVLVTRNDPKDFQNLPGYFDLMVVDAPCSGEGLFRRDSSARQEWSTEHVHFCALRQTRILADLWPALRPGGTLIYCTCTYNAQENQEQLLQLKELGAELLPLEFPSSWGTFAPHSDLGHLAYPHRLQGEGFFLGAVRKRPSEVSPRCAAGKAKSSFASLPRSEAHEVQAWLQNSWEIGEYKGQIVAWPESWQQDMPSLQTLEILALPVHCAERKGKHLRPVHELSLSLALQTEAFPHQELSFEQAIRYLQGEALMDLPPEKAYVHIRFQGFSLGWVKQSGQRANNLYPQRLRIRMRPNPADLLSAWQELRTILSLQALEQA